MVEHAQPTIPYLLSTIKVETPRDWSGLEAAFAEKRTIGGTVLEVVKGGLRVDVGVRAFMRSAKKDRSNWQGKKSNGGR